MKSPKTPRNPNRNSFFAGIILLVAMILVLGLLGFSYSRVAVTKVRDGQSLQKNAQLLYQQSNTVQAKRGNIFDAVGNPLAENTTTYTLAIVISKTAGKGNYATSDTYHNVAEKIQSVLGGDVSSYENQLNAAKNGTYQVEFGSKGADLKPDVYKRLKALNIPGMTFTDESARYYPNGVFASNLVGLATQSENKKTGIMALTGKMGLEAAYNKQLSGKNGTLMSTVDSSDTLTKKKSVNAENGYDIYTTLNSNLQTTLEKQMDNLSTALEPKSAVAVVVDTQTGNIMAETQRPSYNATTGDGLGDFWANELSEDAYEPGSVMKGISLAAAIDSGNWNANATYKSGTLEIDDSKVTDWNNGYGWGTISYSDGLSLSSNVAMALTEQKMGAKTWDKYIKGFKFLESTKSGLLGEAKGEYQFQYPIEQANTAYGQGISVTPLQMIQAYTAIAGNGEELKPNIVAKIVDPNKNKVIYESKRTVVSKPISEATAKATREQLKAVVYGEKGIGHMYAIPNVDTTGKSGTAQISTNGAYSAAGDSSKEIHSWMGMAPADSPRYLMYIVVKEPQKTTAISTAISDVFKTVMEQALTMTAQDDKVVISSQKEVKVPTVVNETTEQAQKDMTAANLQSVVMGDGQKVVAQSVTGGTKALANERVFLNTGEHIQVPNMAGWSRSTVLAWAKLANVSIVVKGNGFAATQSVVEGVRLDTGIHEITVEFKEPNE
jgi:penicillin-binding protein 2B